MAALLQLSGIRRSYRSGEQTVEVLKDQPEHRSR